ncbi:MAG: hypothetical protein C5B54_04920, partial [Acidobacteria bacterium]
MLRICVIGVGHQGKHHVRFLKSLSGVQLSLIVDRDTDRARQVGEESQIPYAAHYRDHLSEFDAAVIAVPTIDHFTIASELMNAGKHLLIEKPVTATIEEAQQLVDLASQKGIVAHVGFPERFNPAVVKAQSEITRPLFVECHRLGIFS